MFKNNRLPKLALLLAFCSLLMSVMTFANNSCGFTDDKSVFEVKSYFMGVLVCKKTRDIR